MSSSLKQSWKGSRQIWSSEGQLNSNSAELTTLTGVQECDLAVLLHATWQRLKQTDHTLNARACNLGRPGAIDIKRAFIQACSGPLAIRRRVVN